MNRVLVSLLGLCCSVNLSAHGGVPKEVGTQVQAAISTTWRDEGVLLNNGLWQIPGVLMGGEAFPTEKDTSIDEARINLTHRNANGTYGGLQLSSHDNNLDVELHHGFVGYAIPWWAFETRIEAGRTAAQITPANTEHASDRLFSETALPLDAFLGRQLNDEGIRIATQWPDWTLGLESWRGRAFPATSGEDGGSVDAYLHFNGESNHLRWHGGLWWLQADAFHRQDQRYSDSGHNHGNTASVTAPETAFDGRTTMNGLFLRVSWLFAQDSHLKLEAQWMQVDTDGIVRDTTRTASLVGDYEGGWLQGLVQVGAHGFGVRWEQLTLDNQLTGAGAAPLAQSSGLMNQDHNPERFTALYRWQIDPNLTLRVEWVDDRIQEASIDRVGVGFVWLQDWAF